MSQFRWMTKVLVGSWHETRNEAMCEAVGHGQAFLNPSEGAIITLRPFASIETRAA